MSEQLLFWRVDGRKLLEEAIKEHHPVAIFSLFSGGNDSAVLTDWAWRTLRERLTAAVHIDTGTAVPGVRTFVEGFCDDRDISLEVYESGDAFRDLVLGNGSSEKIAGFPGPAGHRYAYTRLKERQIEALVREHKTKPGDRIILLTGGRRAESRRRMANFAQPIQKQGARVWVAPLIDWHDSDIQRYRRRFAVEESDVAALLHRSGECNCLAYAAPGERELLLSLFPEMRWITDLEQEAKARGIKRWQWGARYGEEAEEEPGPLCSDCQMRMAA